MTVHLLQAVLIKVSTMTVIALTVMIDQIALRVYHKEAQADQSPLQKEIFHLEILGKMNFMSHFCCHPLLEAQIIVEYHDN